MCFNTGAWGVLKWASQLNEGGKKIKKIQVHLERIHDLCFLCVFEKINFTQHPYILLLTNKACRKQIRKNNYSEARKLLYLFYIYSGNGYFYIIGSFQTFHIASINLQDLLIEIITHDQSIEILLLLKQSFIRVMDVYNNIITTVSQLQRGDIMYMLCSVRGYACIISIKYILRALYRTRNY